MTMTLPKSPQRRCGVVLLPALSAALAFACWAQPGAADSGLDQALKNLSAKDPAKRAFAAQEVGQFGAGASSAVPSLEHALEDRFPQVRLQAVRSLGAIAKGSSDTKTVSAVVGSLVDRYKDSSQDVRAAAGESIKQIGGGSTEPLLKILHDSQDAGARRFAADRLADSDYFSLDDSAQSSSLMSDHDEEVRHRWTQAFVQAVERCAKEGESCAEKLSRIEPISHALASSDDVVLRRSARTTGIVVDHLKLLIEMRSARPKGLYQNLQAVLSPAGPSLLIFAVICSAICIVLARRASRYKNAALQYATHVDSVSDEKAVQQQKEKARAILKQFVAMPGREEKTGFQIAAAFRDSTDVSGDFYDWFSRADGSVCVYLVDVEGSGIDAAVQATHAANVLRRSLDNGEILKAEELLTAADRSMQRDLGYPSIAVTMDLVEIRPQSIRFANAGMPAPLLFGSGRSQAEPLLAAGVYVGDGYSRYPVHPRYFETSVTDGDLLVLFSDGVSETRDRASAIFGHSGIEMVVARHRDEPPEVIAKAILEAAAKYSGQEKPEDDQTVVVVRFGRSGGNHAGARTFEVVRKEATEADFVWVNSVDVVDVADAQLYLEVMEWLEPVGERDLKPRGYPGTGKGRIWCAIWESLMNAVAYGSYRGDVLSLRIRRASDRIEVELEQPREWREWDTFLGQARKSQLPAGPPRLDHDEDVSGTASLLRMADSVRVARQGRLLTLVFEMNEPERSEGVKERS